MASHDTAAAPNAHSIGLPNEIISRILFQASTPTFVQLIQTSREFRDVALGHRKVLLHHLHQLPGEEAPITNACLDNGQLFLLLRQRATNHLVGANFTANMLEYRAKAVLDPSASTIAGLDDEYVNMALVYKDSGDIRHYNRECIIKDRINQHPGIKVLKTCQQGRTLSVLCAWPKETENDFSDSDSDSEEELPNEHIIPPSADAQLTKAYHDQMREKTGINHGKRSTIKIDYEKPSRSTKNRYVYRVVHFDVYRMEESRTFTVTGYLDYIPRDFTVSDLDQCAILWDRDTANGRPTQDATVIYYSANQASFHYASEYSPRVVWPKTDLNGKSVKESDPEYLPERITFFKDGRRIKIYGAGGVVPYSITSTSSTQQDPLYASTNIIKYDGFSFHVDTPFFGRHATHYDDLHQQKWCFLTHLCLGVTTLDIGDEDEENEVKMLCILRSQIRAYPESCKHDVSYSRMYHVSGQNATVVARLWGWEEIHMNLTGKETISISPEGTRIAVAMFDKVYVYPLNPRILCDESPVDVSDDESSKLKKKKKKKSRDPWDPAPSSYYKRKKDKNLLNWKVAELRPIVLDLNGAVAHKMDWSRTRGLVTDTNPPLPANMVEEQKDQDTTNEDTLTAASDQPSETTTESTVVAAIPDDEAAADEPVPTTSSEFNPEGSPSQPVADDLQQLPEAGQTPSPIVTKQEAEEGPSVDYTPEQISEGNEPTPSKPELMDVPQEGGSQVTHPASPTSSAMKSLNDESLAPLTNSIVPMTAQSSLNLLNTPPPPSPFASMPTSNTTTIQPTKTTPRKKEKTTELSNVENAILNSFDKVEMQSDSFMNTVQEPKPHAGSSVPSSPVLSKNSPKTKPVASEILSPTAEIMKKQPEAKATNPAMPGPSKIETPTEPLLAQSETKSDTSLVEETKPQPSVLEADDTEPMVKTDLSKASASTTHSQKPVVEAEVDSQTSTRKSHLKRITEDELMILTDRGIQIWNIGAGAKGTRVKRMLPLDESLKGKLPLSKGKQKTEPTC
ncbi:hypothetical protein PMZ80_007908 [Knufia obscura]|nr:hypothetical protein PMZ80_007908 [Knufia obscura]